MKTIPLLLYLSLLPLFATDDPTPLVAGKFGRALDAQEARPAAAAQYGRTRSRCRHTRRHRPSGAEQPSRATVTD